MAGVHLIKVPVDITIRPPIIGGMSPQELITHFRTQAAAAKALGCAQSTVAEWCSDGAIPEGRQYQIELATAGALVADKPALREPMAAPTKEAA